MLRIREAIRKRYTFLPYWYTLFYEHEKSGVPVMRPLWVEFPTEINTFGIDNEYMLGKFVMRTLLYKLSFYFKNQTSFVQFSKNQD